jgi:hypothetical protein
MVLTLRSTLLHYVCQALSGFFGFIGKSHHQSLDVVAFDKSHQNWQKLGPRVLEELVELLSFGSYQALTVLADA